MAYCKNCGNELREGAKFCPKCGNPIIQRIPKEEDGNVKKWVRYGVIAIVLVAACYFVGTLGDSKSEGSTSRQQTEQALVPGKKKGKADENRSPTEGGRSQTKGGRSQTKGSRRVKKRRRI